MESLYEEEQVEQVDDFQLIEITPDLVIKLRTAEDDFNASKKTLFATYIWSGSAVIAKELINMKDLLQGHSIVELGAAAGLPSIVGAKLGAKLVCASDYPSPTVLENLKQNVELNEVESNVVVKDHIWGTDVQSLLEVNYGNQYDFVLAAECLWRHECHEALLQSMKALLKPSGTLIVSYSHHIPDLEDSDDHFFTLCEQAGLHVVERITKVGKHMWIDRVVDNFLVKLAFK